MSVNEAVTVMKKHLMEAVLVLEKNHLVGIFTARDVLFRVAAGGLDVRDTSIADVMTRNPTTIAPDRPFADTLAIMYEGQYRHVPVIEDGFPIGMVSSRDAMAPELEQFMYTIMLEKQTTDVLA